MSESRDAYHHGDLRNALVTAAARLVEEAGPAGFSLREAAREVGVSANAAYRHFDDKSALMAAVAGEGFARLTRRMKRAMEHAAEGRGARPAVARFRAAGRAYVEFAAAHPKLFRLMFGECGASGLRTTEGGPGDETPWTLLGASLDALVAEGVMSPTERPGAELKAWCVVHGFASLALDGHAAVGAGRARASALEALLDFAVQGLVGRMPERASRR
jgi:AcrR family transcriptional regulator